MIWLSRKSTLWGQSGRVFTQVQNTKAGHAHYAINGRKVGGVRFRRELAKESRCYSLGDFLGENRLVLGLER